MKAPVYAKHFNTICFCLDLGAALFGSGCLPVEAAEPRGKSGFVPPLLSAHPSSCGHRLCHAVPDISRLLWGAKLGKQREGEKEGSI